MATLSVSVNEVTAMDTKTAFAPFLQFLATLCVLFLVVPPASASYHGDGCCRGKHPGRSISSGFCRAISSHNSYSSPSCSAMAGGGNYSASSYARLLASYVTIESPPPTPLRIENPFFSAPKSKVFGPDDSTPQPLRVDNPYFKSRPKGQK